MSLITLDSRVDLLRKVEELISTSFAHGFYLSELHHSKPYEKQAYLDKQVKVDNARIQAKDLIDSIKTELLDVIRL